MTRNDSGVAYKRVWKAKIPKKVGIGKVVWIVTYVVILRVMIICFLVVQ
jgi:hypothetical protein